MRSAWGAIGSQAQQRTLWNGWRPAAGEKNTRKSYLFSIRLQEPIAAQLSPKLDRIFHRRKLNGEPGWFRYGNREGFRALDVSANGDLWLISKTGVVFRRVRGTLKKMPGEKMSRIAVGSGSKVWAVNDYEQVFSSSAKQN